MLIRLIGVKFTSLIRGNYQISLFDDPIKKIGLIQAMDKLKKKYRNDIVGRAV
jgi:DNA polymerase IV